VCVCVCTEHLHRLRALAQIFELSQISGVTMVLLNDFSGVTIVSQWYNDDVTEEAVHSRRAKGVD
jgi:hypothetical protein